MSKKFLIAIGVLVFLAVFGYAGWWYFRSKNTPEQKVIEIPEWYKTDKDGDLIPDDKEQELGTDQNEGDTDGDLISDQLEIDVYKTDPLKSDTDGDGYPDGLEIIQGHNPLGT